MTMIEPKMISATTATRMLDGTEKRIIATVTTSILKERNILITVTILPT